MCLLGNPSVLVHLIRVSVVPSRLFGQHPTVHNVSDVLNVEEMASIEDRLIALSTGDGIGDVSPGAIDFLRHLLAAEPGKRPSARECLRHPWLTEANQATRNLENSLVNLKDYQGIYQERVCGNYYIYYILMRVANYLNVSLSF